MAHMTATRQRSAAHLHEHDGMTGGIVASCKACGQRIVTTVRGNTVRCRACKTPIYIPKTARATAEVVQLHHGEGPTVWDPAPSSAVEPEETGQDCPDCDTPLMWSASGTLHYCETCEKPVFPVELLPRIDEQDPRRVPTRAERDLAAIALAQRKGMMLVQLDGLAGDDRIDPASLPIIEWFRDEVKTAGTAGRLDELAELLPQAGITRRRWWQGRPALDSPAFDELDNEEEYDEDQDDEPEAPMAAPQVRAIAEPGADHAALIRANGFYDVDPAAPAGHCQVTALRSGMGGTPFETPQPCGGGGFRQFGPYRLCPSHHQQFTR